MMPTITAEQLDNYRKRTFRLQDGLQLRNQEEALNYVQERGFVYFWPIKNITFPSLWTAVAGNRVVADKHDDPGHVTWGWKDSMLDKRRWYYGKILRGKATMISLENAPYFYALSENYGDPENDYLQLYEDGLLSREAKMIYEALLHKGPLDTVNLRRVIHMTGKASNSPFERNLVALQRDFKILPVGIAEAGAWRYSFIYDLVHRFYPELSQQARSIKRSESQHHLATLYFDSVGAATMADMSKLFQWPKRDIERTLTRLSDDGTLVTGYQVEGQKGEHFVVAQLANG
jgi:hypothetical protein